MLSTKLINVVRHFSMLFVALSLVTVLPSYAQTGADKWRTEGKVRVLPPTAIDTPTGSLRDATAMWAVASQTPGLADSVLLAFSRAYTLQARALRAQAARDDDGVRALLDSALTVVARLSLLPGIDERPRYRELYRTLITEYESVLGPPDTLDMPVGDILSYRAALFGELNSLSDPLLEDVDLPALAITEATVPLKVNRLVESSIQYLLRSPENHLNNWLRRAETYFPMIETILAEEGVPDEIKYLAMIESGLNPRARSWARAVGMWQFISATGNAYGLQSNRWVDDRMDPEAATRAAARHLKDLNTMFDGDWLLTLAGYNFSPGKLRYRLRKEEQRLGRKATFWDVYHTLPRETRNYVPMFIATAIVVSQADAFGIHRVEPGPTYAYHRVPVYGMLSLAEVADLAGTDIAKVRALNPSLRRDRLPPSTGPFPLKIPLGSYERFTTQYAALPEDQKSPTSEHVVRTGETLGGIAQGYGLTVRTLMSHNGLRSTTIHPGDRLAVPVRDYAASTQAEASTALTEHIVHYGSRIKKPIASALVVPEPVVQAPSPPSVPVAQVSSTTRTQTQRKVDRSGQTRVVYRVRRGDTLSEIAEKYGVRIRDVRTWNNIRGSRIRAGQRLYIYVPRGDNTSADATSEYRVQRGDTLGGIARRFGVSVGALKQWNGLPSEKIVAGQTLRVRG